MLIFQEFRIIFLIETLGNPGSLSSALATLECFVSFPAEDDSFSRFETLIEFFAASGFQSDLFFPPFPV